MTTRSGCSAAPSPGSHKPFPIFASGESNRMDLPAEAGSHEPTESRKFLIFVLRDFTPLQFLRSSLASVRGVAIPH
jgi:hypothetical protein